MDLGINYNIDDEMNINVSSAPQTTTTTYHCDFIDEINRNNNAVLKANSIINSNNEENKLNNEAKSVHSSKVAIYNTKLTPEEKENALIINLLNKKYEHMNNKGIPKSFSFIFNNRNSHLKYRFDINDAAYKENCLVKTILGLQSLVIELASIYFFSIILLIASIVAEKIKENKIDPEERLFGNGKYWTYKCNLDNEDIIFNIIELSIFVIIILKGKKLMNYKVIFKCTKYISYSSFFGVFLGPFVNTICALVLSDQRYLKAYVETISNSIGYLIIFILFVWDKYYFVIKKKNNPALYFIFVLHNKCIIHSSYTCGCALEVKNEDFTSIINKYIMIYRDSSSPFEIRKGIIRISARNSIASLMSVDSNEAQ